MSDGPVLYQWFVQLAAVFGVLSGLGAGIWSLSALSSRVRSHGHLLDRHEAELKELRVTSNLIDHRMTRMEAKQDSMLEKLDRLILHGCDRAEDAHGRSPH